MFKVHKRNVFEVNLPNKVTKIMQVVDNVTVRQAIQPVLRKYGYTFDMMELKFANTLKVSMPAVTTPEVEVYAVSMVINTLNLLCEAFLTNFHEFSCNSL